MKLLSHEYTEHSVELTFADAPHADDAKTLLIARVPFEVEATKSVAWNRYWSLKQLHDTLGQLVEQERQKLGIS